MAGIKALAKETAIYGVSSILGRFLNWCLVPLYVYIFPTEEYGIVSYLYSLTAVALVVLNYGMETGFFRFAAKPGADPERIYSTTLISTACSSALFIFLLLVLLGPASRLLLLPHHPEYVALLGITVAIDAFCNIPFANLRRRKRAVRFAAIKLINVFSNIALNLFFILACPAIWRHCPGAIGWFYAPLGGEAFGIGWIFVANLISTLIVLGCLLPDVVRVRFAFDAAAWRRMLAYSWPLLILGVAGIMSQNMGQMLMPYIFEGHETEARSMVGIYGANIKIAIVMVMFAQAFRYAYEPFIFARAGAADKQQAYCDAMKYFVIFGLFIFLGVMYFLPVLKHFVAPGYWSGLQVVPVMMIAELCFGIFFNLSLWYKLTDRTQWGMYLSLLCFVLMLGFNLWLVPMIGIPNGYMGSAWAALISYFIVMCVSYFLSRKYYPLLYETGRIFLYILFAGVLYTAGEYIGKISGTVVMYAVRILLLVIYLGVVVKIEKVPVPGLRRR